jgi:hypothetical protein
VFFRQNSSENRIFLAKNGPKRAVFNFLKKKKKKKASLSLIFSPFFSFLALFLIGTNNNTHRIVETANPKNSETMAVLPFKVIWD